MQDKECYLAFAEEDSLNESVYVSLYGMFR
jgi:hypothetical protein